MLTIFLQRIMELLALYLILANINGKDLKEAFEDLFMTKQRILYENIILFFGYSLIISFLIREMGETGYFVVHAFQPFIGLFLIKSLEINKALLSTVLLGIFSSIIAIPNVFISLHTLINFGLLLLIVALVVYQNFLHKMFVYLESKKHPLNFIYSISLLIYIFPLVFTSNIERTFLIAIMLLGFYLLMRFFIKSEMKKELSKTIDLITGSSYDETISLLQELSSEYQIHPEVIKHFIINEKSPSAELIDALSNKLETFKNNHKIKTYDCNINRKQIKISIIL